MSICNSCNGVIGRDCFNTIECAEITHRIMQEIHEQDTDPWQPIDTAPEKTTVDLWSSKYGRVPDCRKLVDGWYDNSFHTRRIYDATHWRELPQPPVNSSRES